MMKSGKVEAVDSNGIGRVMYIQSRRLKYDCAKFGWSSNMIIQRFQPSFASCLPL